MIERAMRAYRFGIGAMAGLVLGLLVVVSSILSTTGTFGSMAPLNPERNVGQSITYTSIISSSLTGQKLQPNSTSYTGSIAVTSVTTSSNTTGFTNYLVAGVGSVPSNTFSSHIRDVLSQSPVINGLLLVPIAVGVVVGLLVYRTATMKEEPSPDVQEESESATTQSADN
jgi:hypothetical protein